MQVGQGSPIVSPPPAPQPSSTNVSVTIPTPDPVMVKQTGLELATAVGQAVAEGINGLGRAALDAGGIWRCDPMAGVLDIPQVAALTSAIVAIALGGLAVVTGWTALRVTREETTWGESLPRLISCAVLAAIAKPALGLAANVTVGVCHSVASTDVTGRFAGGVTIPGAISPLAGIVVELLFGVALLLVAIRAWQIVALWAVIVITAPLAAAAYAIPQLQGIATTIGRLGIGAHVGFVGMVIVLTVAQPIMATWGTAAPLGQIALQLALLTMAWKIPDLIMKQAGGNAGLNLMLLLRLIRK